MEKKTEIVIIGAGIGGLMCAYSECSAQG